MSTEELGGAKVLRPEGALDVAHRLAAARGAAIVLAAPPGPVDRVVALTRTDRLLRIFPNVAEGLAALAGRAA